MQHHISNAILFKLSVCISFALEFKMPTPEVVPFDPKTMLPFSLTSQSAIYFFEGIIWAVKDEDNVFMNIAEPGSSGPVWVKSTESMARIMLSGRRLEDASLKTMYQIKSSDMPNSAFISAVSKNEAFDDSIRTKALEKYRALTPPQAALRISRWLRDGGDDDLSTALGFWIGCPDHLKMTAIDCLGDMIEEALLPDLISEVMAESK
jgi:hypothetical protein